MMADYIEHFWDKSHDDPEFLRFTEGGSVHVMAGRRTLGFGLTEVMLARQLAECGRSGNAGEQFGLSAFSDGDLCMACWKKTPEDHRDRLFEHEVEG